MGFDPQSIFGHRSKPRVIRSMRPKMSKRRIIGFGLVALVILVLLVGRTLLGLRVDYLFLSNLGHSNVFWTPFVAQVILFAIGFVLTGALLALNIPAWRAAARHLDVQGPRWALWIGVVVVVIGGIAGGGFMASQWQQILLFLHGRSFGATDPVFGQDYSFYLFTLPVLDALQAIGWGVVIFSILAAVGIAILAAAVAYTPAEVSLPLRPPAGRTAAGALPIAARHAGMVLVAIFIMAALGAHFGVYHLTTTQHSDPNFPNFVGLDVTQRNVVRPVLGVLQWVMVAFAALTAFILAVRWRQPAERLSGVLAGLLVLSIIGSGLAQVVPPLIYQGAYATPNAQSTQLPSMSDFLSASRYAWSLQSDKDVPEAMASVTTKSFSQQVSAPTLSDLAADPGTLNNIRIQDVRQLPDTLNQIQKTRSYQNFPSITVDRYATQNGDVEVMLSPREINSGNVSAGFNTQSLIYTHGYGIAAVSVNSVDQPSGNPTVLVGEVGENPMTQISPGAPASLAFNGSSAADPRIYCGLSTDQNVVVNTKAKEFDYPRGTGDATSSAGDVNGIGVGNFIDRLALSVVDYGGVDLLLTNQLTPQSRALIHRTISDRVQTLAPFLTVDSDPYVVVDPASNHLMYIADAYVKSDLFPNSYQMSDGTSYMRNAVKAVVDAKTCNTTLYAVDSSEPLTAAYGSIYPGLLTPLSQMPAFLRQHLRYPEDLFTNQAQVYAQVHVSSASVFFNGSDRYRIAQEVVDNQTQDTKPNYVELTLPGDSKPSFVLLQTFSSGSGSSASGGTSASNMTAWLAAECDYTDTAHPKLAAVPLNNAVNVRGPLQFDNNINTDSTISKDISLLNQNGSSVKLGNVIVLPFNNRSFLYVRPLYVAASGAGGSSFPQLKRVLVGTQNSVAEGNTLSDALQVLFNTSEPIPGLEIQGSTTPVTPAPNPTPTPGQQTVPVSSQELALINDLLKHEQAAQDAFKRGDFAAYGTDQAAIQSDAAQLRQLLAGPSPAPSPSATSSPSPG